MPRVIRKKIKNRFYANIPLYPSGGHIKTRKVTEDEDFNLRQHGFRHPIVTDEEVGGRPYARNYRRKKK